LEFAVSDYPLTEIRAVSFDFDGLMFNTEDLYWEASCELLRRRGHEFTRELSDAMMGRLPKASFEAMIRWCSLDDTWQELEAESDELYIQLLDRSLAPMPGLTRLLDALETAGIPKAICTSSRRRFLAAVLSQFDMEHRFQFTLAAEDISHGKPHPEIYLTAAGRFGLAPSETLVFEDSQIGCESAAAAGTFVIAVPGDLSRGQDFSPAAMVVGSLQDPRVYEALGLAVGDVS
jgi:HAD superfamily hydrolase (TIGR01509 family)